MAKKSRSKKEPLQETHQESVSVVSAPAPASVPAPAPAPVELPAVEQSAAPSLDPASWTFGGESATAIIEYYGNKSKAIRALREQGLEFAVIARAIGVRYQMVRNVLDRPLKRLIKAQRDARSNNNA